MVSVMNWQKRFIKTIQSFMEKEQLFPPSKKAFIAVSGGVDSMVLLYSLKIISELRADLLEKIEVIHINHGTRGKENREEELMVNDFCRKLEISFNVFYWENGKEKIEGKGNFEEAARNFRQNIFKKCLENGDRVYLAHHLDDSFEWSLMQQFKSSGPLAFLGIPVKNGPFYRPFLTVTKDQILKLAKICRVPYQEDKSNFDVNYERNYVRNKIIPVIKERYPAYLKNYVSRANFFAKSEENNLSLQGKRQKGYGVILAIKDEIEKEEKSIIDILHSLSSKKRGSLREQRKRLIEAFKQKKEGPMTFSGGVNAYLFRDKILFITKDELYNFKKLDEKWFSFLLKQKFAEKRFDCQKFEKEVEEKCLFPSLIFMASKKRDNSYFFKKRKRIHPLFPLVTRYFIDNDIWWNFSHDVLPQWRKRGKEEIFSFVLLGEMIKSEKH